MSYIPQLSKARLYRERRYFSKSRAYPKSRYGRANTDRISANARGFRTDERRISVPRRDAFRFAPTTSRILRKRNVPLRGRGSTLSSIEDLKRSRIERGTVENYRGQFRRASARYAISYGIFGGWDWNFFFLFLFRKVYKFNNSNNSKHRTRIFLPSACNVSR